MVTSARKYVHVYERVGGGAGEMEPKEGNRIFGILEELKEFAVQYDQEGCRSNRGSS